MQGGRIYVRKCLPSLVTVIGLSVVFFLCFPCFVVLCLATMCDGSVFRTPQKLIPRELRVFLNSSFVFPRDSFNTNQCILPYCTVLMMMMMMVMVMVVGLRSCLLPIGVSFGVPLCYFLPLSRSGLLDRGATKADNVCSGVGGGNAPSTTPFQSFQSTSAAVVIKIRFRLHGRAAHSHSIARENRKSFKTFAPRAVFSCFVDAMSYGTGSE